MTNTWLYKVTKYGGIECDNLGTVGAGCGGDVGRPAGQNRVNVDRYTEHYIDDYGKHWIPPTYGATCIHAKPGENCFNCSHPNCIAGCKPYGEKPRKRRRN